MSLKARIISVTPFQQNCALIWDSETMEGAVTDPGGEIDRIIAVAKREGVKIGKILVTHGHLDHASAVKSLSERLDVPVEGPEEQERFWIEKIPEQCRAYGFPEGHAFVPSRWLKDGDKVNVGGRTLDVIHCPGHTPGHVVFVDKDARIAIAGDVIFQGSIGRTDFPMGDHDALIASIRDKLFPLGDDITFIPGHGPVSTFGAERLNNPYVADRLFPVSA